MKMDKVQALRELLWQAGRDQVSMTGYEMDIARDWLIEQDDNDERRN